MEVKVVSFVSEFLSAPVAIRTLPCLLHWVRSSAAEVENEKNATDVVATKELIKAILRFK